MKRYSLLLAAPLLLLFISQSLGLVSSSKNIDSYGEVTYPSPSLGWLHTEGRWIKDESGRTVVLRGACWQKSCYQSSHPWFYKMTPDRIDLYKSCGANVLFVPLNKKAWELEPEYVAEIDTIVNLCEQRGIYVILYFYDYVFLDVDPPWDMAARWATLTNPSAVEDIINWEKTVATRYRTRPHVIGFGTINEPILWERDPYYAGLGYTPEQVLQTLRNFHIQAIRGLHSVNPNLLIFVQGSDWANLLTDYVNNSLTEPNVVYNFHHYYYFALRSLFPYAVAYRDGRLAEAKTLYEQFLKDRGALNIMTIANKPLLFGEFGILIGDPCPNEEVWLRDHFDLMRQYGCSWTYWSYDAWSSGWVLVEADWKTLNKAGIIWRDELSK